MSYVLTAGGLVYADGGVYVDQPASKVNCWCRRFTGKACGYVSGANNDACSWGANHYNTGIFAVTVNCPFGKSSDNLVYQEAICWRKGHPYTAPCGRKSTKTEDVYGYVTHCKWGISLQCNVNGGDCRSGGTCIRAWSGDSL